MKKVLVLAAMLAMTATQALAFSSVVDSAHNMNNQASLNSNASQEVCVFCHTPHGADISNTNAPLWNRQAAAAITDYYNSATLDQTNSRPNVVSSAIGNSDAPLCLTCHGGSGTVINPLLNPPNAGAPTWNTPFVYASADANISLDLSNDHPIGMTYSAVQTADSAGFFAPGTVTAGGLQFFGGKMWCSSCHDVHDDSYYPFLATTNQASNLCLTCHNK